MSVQFSVVTISFNQVPFLPAAMNSVLTQEGPEIEYIICDPGSTDGSRELVEAAQDPRIFPVFEKDEGPADGLNKGFARATGNFYCYLNSDDMFLPGAFDKVQRYFERHPQVDVLTGHAKVIDSAGRELRKVWSEPFSRRPVAYGAHVQIQPSTFIRAEAFRRTNGFDSSDSANWDGGLLTSLFLANAKFAVIDEFLSCYRLHDESITMSGRLAKAHHYNMIANFERLMGRSYRPYDHWIGQVFRLAKHLRWPARALHRVLHGPLFQSS